MKRNAYSWFGLLAFLLLLVGLNAGPAHAQTDNCINTPEGRICTLTQEIRQGVLVPIPRQQELGLVTVGGGCSGTLVNRFWVLTADHCVTTNGRINGPAAALNALPITAAWSTRAPIPTRLVRNWGASGLDVALIFLGADDFGPVNIQLFFVGEVESNRTLTKYGRGIFEYASAGPPPVPAQQDVPGRYRSARFTVSGASATGYTLPVNAAGQVGQGGDSGGPDIVTDPDDGVSLGIAGVQSTCQPSGRVPGMPNTPVWTWVTGITECTSAAISTIRWDILQIIQEGGPSPKGVIYSITRNDDLLWNRVGVGGGKKVGTGWNFEQVFSGGDGIIYAITPRVEATLPTGITIDGRPTGGRPASDGDLMWYRHDGRNDGSFRWAFSEGKKVGTGWGNFKHVFSGGDGIIYAITPRVEATLPTGITIDGRPTGGRPASGGDLMWYRHTGREDGSFRWAFSEGKKVGTGWDDFKQVFSGGDGVIYAITPRVEAPFPAVGAGMGRLPASGGDLMWYRHTGREDGSFRWAFSEGKKVGVEWSKSNFKQIFPE